MTGSERLHSKASLLKTSKGSKDQKETPACTLRNGGCKTRKAQGERLCRSHVLGMLPSDFIKTEFHS